MSNEIFSTRRMEALTDGVFAIAMTILILDIKVENFGDPTTNAQLVTAFINNGTNLISFIVSFLLLGSMWSVHMRQFEYITHTNRHLNMVNTLRLLIVVFMPLTTSISSAFPDLILGRILLPLNFLALTIVSYWQWRYAINPRNHLAKKIPKSFIRKSDIRNIAIIVTSAIVVLLSIFIGDKAFLALAILPLILGPIQKKFA